ncbi:MAG: site-specific DNA-methyltransferase [Rhodospirillales bacterium]|nr:site-specific DNA-methyltransferase [Rhodospirillales bacterium]
MTALEHPQVLDLGLRFERLSSIDWDFSLSASQSLFSTVHWHPCRFPSQLPATLIGSLTVPGETVFDPFVGSGTTAVEAQRLGRSGIGVEINPVAALLSRAKTIAEPRETIEKTVQNLKLLARQASSTFNPPPSVQGEKWYTGRVLRGLCRLRSILEVPQLTPEGRLIFEAAFSAILLPVCRETRHWGYVCDNTSPKGDHERDVIQTFEDALDTLTAAYHDRDEYWREGGTTPTVIPSVQIWEGDARMALSNLGNECIDLIVTSPPYFGVTDYAKAQRLSLEWMELSIEQIRLKEIGARSKRHRMNAKTEYIRECQEVFVECRRVLRHGRACCVVLGQSAHRVSVLEEFLEVMGIIGFKLQFSAERKISTRRRLNPSLQYENLLIFV